MVKLNRIGSETVKSRQNQPSQSGPRMRAKKNLVPRKMRKFIRAGFEFIRASSPKGIAPSTFFPPYLRTIPLALPALRMLRKFRLPRKVCETSRLFTFSVWLNHSSASAVRDVPFDWDHSFPDETEELNDVRTQGLKRYSSLLREFASRKFLTRGRAVHGHLLRHQVDLDSHLWVSLLNFYAKCANLLAARRLFVEMPEKDVVSWTTIMSGFVSKGYGRDGAEIFSEMMRDGVRPNEYALATCLKGCSAFSDLLLGKQVHSLAIRLGLSLDIYVGSSLVEVYSKCSQMELAASVFSGLSKQNAILWNLMLNGYLLIGNTDEVLRLFNRLKESEIKFGNFTLNSILKCCANSGIVREGRILHCVAIKIGSDTDNVIGCSLVHMYSKCSLAADSLTAFSRIKDPDVVTWTTMIACLDKQANGLEAAQVFNVMRQRGLKPNLFSLSSIMNVAGNIGSFVYGTSIHALTFKYGYDIDVTDKILVNSLVSMYMKIGSPYDSLRVLYGRRKKDSVSSNITMMESEGFQVHQMLLGCIKLDVPTLVNVLKCCSHLKDVSFGRQIHAHVVKHNVSSNKFVGTTLIDMYAKSRCFDDAILAFRLLMDKDVLTWTTIISGLMHCDKVEKGFGCFILMQREGIRPNGNTLSTCLSGSSRIASLSSGKLLHSMAIKGGHLLDMFVINGIINMYGKCGPLEDAEAMFNGSISRDLTLWNSIICLYSLHYQGQKTLDTFRLMLHEGFLPDHITFVGILTACSRMGLIDEGKMHFRSMGETFGVETTIEHCVCMVNMLGRAGRFDEVESFTKEMNISASGSIWEAVLGTCEMHKNENLGQRAAEKLFELNPEEASNYVLLSNIFAAKKNWDSVEEVRGLMTRKGVKKELACSWVEIDGRFHVFYSRDFSHPKLEQIYVKLEELSQQLLLVDYKPRTGCVLQNVSEIEKKEYLHYHSERLALAFALISSNSMKIIRIFKNNRICSDCHEMMRLISERIDQEIIIRDIHHFHKFTGGACSCQCS